MYIYNIDYERDMLINGKFEDNFKETATVSAKTADKAIAKLKSRVMRAERWTDEDTKEKMVTTYKNFELVKLTRGDYIDY